MTPRQGFHAELVNQIKSLSLFLLVKSKNFQAGLFGGDNPNLHAEKRVDKKGRVTTKWVKSKDPAPQNAPEQKQSQGLFDFNFKEPEPQVKPKPQSVPDLFSYDFREPEAPNPTLMLHVGTPAKPVLKSSKDQPNGAAKNTARLLEKLGIAEDVLSNEDFHAHVTNPPYIPLSIERVDGGSGAPKIAVTHYLSQNGDAYIDSESLFVVQPDGTLKYEGSLAGGLFSGGRHRFDPGFARMFSKNLLDQDFGDPKKLLRDPYRRDQPEMGMSPRENDQLSRGELHVGDSKMLDGVMYRLNQNHRWERMDAQEAVAPSESTPPSRPLPKPADREHLVGLPADATPNQRKAWNKEATDLLSKLQEENRPATDAEKTVLARYSGNGGVGANLNEFYTPPELAQSMWGILQKLGAGQGEGLEPSSGPGVMLQFAPTEAKMDAVELSPISAGIAQQVFGDRHQIHNMGFEVFSTSNPDKEFDFIIGNPPFGDRGEMTALDMPDEKECARYFTLRSLDHLKPGGVAVLVLPAGMARNKNDDELRRKILARAEVMAIHALPTSTFSRAGTEAATTDVWVLKGRDFDLRAGLEAAGQTGMEALGIWDQAYIDGKFHDAHPEQMHAQETSNALGWYMRDGELNQDLLSNLVDHTPEAGSAYTLSDLQHVLQHNDALLSRVNSAVLRDEGLKEGAVRQGKHGLQVCKNGRWQNVEQNTAKAFTDGQQLSDLIKLHSTLISNLDYEGANTMRVQVERLLREYLNTHGNPHEHKDLKGLIRNSPALNNLLAALSPNGEISEVFTRDASRPMENVDANDLGSVVRNLRRNRKPSDLKDIAGLYAGQFQDDQDLARQLLTAGFTPKPDGHWVPTGEILMGDGQELLNIYDGAARAANVSEAYRMAFQHTVDVIKSKIPRKTLEEINPSPRMGIVPDEAVRLYAFQVCKDMGLYLSPEFQIMRLQDGKFAMKGGAYSRATAVNFLTRYLNGEKRRGDEADIYKDLDAQFGDFLTQSGYRDQVEQAYSEKNAWIEPEWDLTPIDHQIEGWNPDIKLHPWQNEAANRCIAQGGGIISLDVGLGKTFTGIALTLKARQDGLTSRAVVAVPKSVVSKWRADFLAAKPNAKILVIGAEPVLDLDGQIKKDADGNEVWKEVTGAAALDGQLARLKAEEWDSVLLTHDTLKRVPMSTQRQLELIEAEFEAQQGKQFYHRPDAMSTGMFAYYTQLKAKAMLANGELSLDELKSASQEVARLDTELKALTGKKNLSSAEQRDKAAKKEQRARAKFLANAHSRLNTQSNDLQTTWDELGIDHLLIDEAHEYKGLWQPTAGRETIKYLGAGDTSQQAVDLYYKSMDIRQRTGGRGVYPMTATPIKNSPIEIYSLMSYTMPELFKRAGIHNVDQFIERYCSIEDEYVLGRDGEGKYVKSLNGLQNLKELRELAARCVNRKTAKQVGLPLPEEKTEYLPHRPTVEQAKIIDWITQNPLQAIADYMGRMDIPANIETWKNSQDPKQKDAYRDMFSRFRLVLAHLMRRAEMDLEMLDPVKHKGYISPKVQSLLNDLKATVGKGQKAVVFCDSKDMPDPLSAFDPEAGGSRSINPNGYSFHRKLKNLIAEHLGIKPEEVAIANAEESPTADSRQEIARGIASGKYKVVLGNTATMGQGMDLQKGVENLFHLDVPWNPADLQQRLGRVIRQGNKSDAVQNRFYLGTRGLDKQMVDILRGKTNWYDEFWNGDSDTIENNGSSTIPSIEQFEALSLSDDEEREKALERLAESENQKRITGERVQAMQTFKKLQSTTRALQKHQQEHAGNEKGELTPAQQRTRDTLTAQIQNYSERLKEMESFHPFLEHLQNPTQVMIEPISGKTFKLGDSFLARDGKQAYAYQVVALDHKGGRVAIAEFEPDQPPSGRFNTWKVSDLATKEVEPYNRLEHFRSHISSHGLDNAMPLDSDTMQAAQEGLRERAMRNDDHYYLMRRQGRVTHLKGKDIKPEDQFLLNTDQDKRDAQAYLNQDHVIQHQREALARNASTDLRYVTGSAHHTASHQGMDVSRDYRTNQYLVKAATSDARPMLLWVKRGQS